MRSYYNNYNSGGYGGNPYLTPAVRWLIFANIGVFSVQIIFISLLSGWFPRDFITSYFALIPTRVIEDFWIWQLVTSCFLHDPYSLFHIFFNLLTLYFFGHLPERTYGTQKFYICYFFSAVFSSLVFCVVHYTQGTQSAALGASGAIMGILMVAARLAPDNIVYFSLIFPIRMRTMIWFLIAIDLYTALMSPNGGVAAVSHLGGLAAGHIFFTYSDRIFLFFERLDQQITIQHNREQRKKIRVSREEVDRLLDKISKNGINSLSQDEKEFLKKASKEYQKE